MPTQEERLTQEGYEICPSCGHAFNAHGPWILHPGDKTCIEIPPIVEEEEDEEEEPPEEMYCEYHNLFHWPCF